MARYELIVGLKPDLSANGQKKILEKAKDLIGGVGGKVGNVKSRGLTELAYPIEGFSEANFTTIFFEIPGEQINALQKELRLIKGVLRAMVVRGEVKPR